MEEGIGRSFPQPVPGVVSHTATNLLDVRTSEGTRRVSHAYVQAVSHCSPPNSHIALCHHGNKFPVINAPILIKENRKRAVTVHVEVVGHICCVQNAEVVNIFYLIYWRNTSDTNRQGNLQVAQQQTNTVHLQVLLHQSVSVQIIFSQTNNVCYAVQVYISEIILVQGWLQCKIFLLLYKYNEMRFSASFMHGITRI